VNPDQGVIYVATGKKFLELAAKSARSLKNNCPGLRAHIFTDCNAASYDCFDSSTKILDPHFRSKVDYIFQSPFQQTLFLDADTRVCEDILGLFTLLDKYDIGMAHEPSRGAERMKLYPGSIPNSFAPLNSGVILFNRTDPVIEFFKSWKKAYHQENYNGDQSTLRELVWLTDLRFVILPTEYNVRYKFYIKTLDRNKISPKILHLSEFKDEQDIIPEGTTLSLRKKLKRKLKKFFMRKQST